jgi:hypothetical protein
LSSYNLKNFSGLFLKSKSFDSSRKFFSGDLPTFIVIKDVEAFLESKNVVSRQIFGGIVGGVESGGLLGQG